MLPNKHFLSPGNPLAVIALFVWLTYGVAAVLFGSAAERLTGALQYIAMGFMVTFPYVVLWCFYILVRDHHQKLYAPKDWKDERLLFGMPPPNHYGNSLQNEAEAGAGLAQGGEGGEEVLSSGEEQQSATDPVQHDTKQDGPSVPTNMGEPSSISIRSRVSEFAIAEGLVFLELQGEFNAPVRRQVLVTGKGTPVVDGVIVADGKTYLVEVKSARVRGIMNATKDGANFLERVAANLDRNRYKLLLVVVTDNQLEAEVSRRARELLRDRDVELRVYALDELMQKYGMPSE